MNKLQGTKYHYVKNGSITSEMILCLHDFGDVWNSWRNQLTSLSHSHRVIALDLKGFGDSEEPFIASKYTDNLVVEELKKFIDMI
jgi:pimeloyl-ACP methyl ester carboxylesterase